MYNWPGEVAKEVNCLGKTARIQAVMKRRYGYIYIYLWLARGMERDTSPAWTMSLASYPIADWNVGSRARNGFETSIYKRVFWVEKRFESCSFKQFLWRLWSPWTVSIWKSVCESYRWKIKISKRFRNPIIFKMSLTINPPIDFQIHELQSQIWEGINKTSRTRTSCLFLAWKLFVTTQIAFAHTSNDSQRQCLLSFKNTFQLKLAIPRLLHFLEIQNGQFVSKSNHVR